MGAPGESWRKELGLSREAKVMHRIKVWVRRREDLEKKLKGKTAVGWGWWCAELGDWD